MKITDAKQGMGKSVARSATVDRNAYRSGGNVGAALMEVGITATNVAINLKMAEEEAKADELRTGYEIEYNDKVQELESEHRNTNLAATEYESRHQAILTDLKSKYSTAHSFDTVYGKNLQSFLDTDGEVKRQRFNPVIEDVAMQNQQVSWAKSEQNRMNAAVGSDYQTLQNMIAEQRAVYNTPQYQVAYGAKAIAQEQGFIDQSSVNWVKSQLSKGSNPYEMLHNVQEENMFVGISESARTNMTLTLKTEVKRREAAAKAAAKAKAESNELAFNVDRIRRAGAINPKDKKDRAAFAALLKEEVSIYASEQERDDAAVAFRIEHGYIEQEEASAIIRTFNSQNEGYKELAVQRMMHYVKSNKSMAEYFTNDMQEIANLMSTGYNSKEAVEFHMAMQNLPEHRVDAITAQLKDKDLVSESVSNVAGRFEERWDMDSTMGIGGWDRPAELERVSELLFKKNYVVYNGNTEAAETATNQQLAKSWGVSNIGGTSTLMYQAPSTYVRDRKPDVEFEPDAINRILVSDLIGQGIKEEDAERATIVRVPSNDSKGNPQYQVMIDGQAVQKKGRNIPLWTLYVNDVVTELESENADYFEIERKKNKARIKDVGGFNSLKQL